ncbi:MAG: excinuclease ABC subunit UvrB [Candidatus Delongbacteria bacterium]|nr:excinuclease ABC subunit UvrB [Candidatus Delongbacteria bacterium]MBN2836037.1 excinuclease ABC subunit UvrB [Candidatus Delongbacteria bacterium]
MVNKLKIVSEFKPTGDQPKAIEVITENFRKGLLHQTLLGVTGSGKTFTMANVIQDLQIPTLVLCHNKTLAAQLYGELKNFFPENAVEYFISYYDYYQPEAYVPSSDLYIEKTTSINDEIEKLRLKATSSLVTRKDVIVVASVSCIYGLGSPSDYKDMSVKISVGDKIKRGNFFERMIEMQYQRNRYELTSGSFRVKGDVIDIHPAYDNMGIRVETFGNEIEKISIINFLTGELVEEKDEIIILPSKHFVVSKPKIDMALDFIREEMDERIEYFTRSNKLIEAQRIEQRTKMDLEFLKEMGTCNGVENYSRHLSGREEGDRPFCLLDFFPEDFLLIIDESHTTIPQVRAMYNGDRSRKMNLVDYGFRLPSALDNRPLKFDEFESINKKMLYVSATPADYEIEKSGGEVVEQVIRPTGIIDPEIIVRPVNGQVDDFISELASVIDRDERVLVTTLTKRMSEDLTLYLVNHGVKARYLHSEIDSIERVEIIRDLRLGKFDVLVGINLLREGLDLPEVSLVAIFDADREGFLRNRRSLLQTAGRAARNVNSKVIFYAEKITDSMQLCIDETNRRREIQSEYNRIHNITPVTVRKSVDQILKTTDIKDNEYEKYLVADKKAKYSSKDKIHDEIKELKEAMMKAAAELKFEIAAELRDRINELVKIVENSK